MVGAISFQIRPKVSKAPKTSNLRGQFQIADRFRRPCVSRSVSSERLALTRINTSEEMGQARDASTLVTFNALNSTSSHQILDSLFMLFDRREGETK